jgi:hypothetical protein
MIVGLPKWGNSPGRPALPESLSQAWCMHDLRDEKRKKERKNQKYNKIIQ